MRARVSFSPIGEGINLARDPIGLVLILSTCPSVYCASIGDLQREKVCVFGSLAVQTPGTKLYLHMPKQTILILKCYNYNLGLFIGVVDSLHQEKCTKASSSMMTMRLYIVGTWSLCRDCSVKASYERGSMSFLLR